MKKITKKLGLNRETIRVLASDDLDGVNGGGADGASPTTTVKNHSQVSTVTAPCKLHSWRGIAMCVAPPPTV